MLLEIQHQRDSTKANAVLAIFSGYLALVDVLNMGKKTN